MVTSYADVPRPFKTRGYTKSTQRRNKNVKQILSSERDRYGRPKKNTPKNTKRKVTNSLLRTAAAAAASRAEDNDDNNNEPIDTSTNVTTTAPTTQPPSPASPAVTPPRREEYVGIYNLEAPPSLYPLKKYCDITGLEAPYVDPKTTLRYHNAEIYELIKDFGPGVPQSYLSLRGAGMSFF